MWSQPVAHDGTSWPQAHPPPIVGRGQLRAYGGRDGWTKECDAILVRASSIPGEGELPVSRTKRQTAKTRADWLRIVGGRRGGSAMRQIPSWAHSAATDQASRLMK